MFTSYLPTKIVFGTGAIEKLSELVRNLGKSAMIVTGKKSTKVTGLLDRVIDSLKNVGIESVVFDKVQPNPISDDVDEAAKIAIEKSVDFMVGLGGGSAIDSAKAIAIAAAMKDNFWNYTHAGGKKKTRQSTPHRRDTHHARHGYRSRSVRRDHQSEDEGKSRYRLRCDLSENLHRGSFTHDQLAERSNCLHFDGRFLSLSGGFFEHRCQSVFGPARHRFDEEDRFQPHESLQRRTRHRRSNQPRLGEHGSWDNGNAHRGDREPCDRTRLERFQRETATRARSVHHWTIFAPVHVR